jgi:hypothetical protein
MALTGDKLLNALKSGQLKAPITVSGAVRSGDDENSILFSPSASAESEWIPIPVELIAHAQVIGRSARGDQSFDVVSLELNAPAANEPLATALAALLRQLPAQRQPSAGSAAGLSASRVRPFVLDQPSQAGRYAAPAEVARQRRAARISRLGFSSPLGSCDTASNSMVETQIVCVIDTFTGTPEAPDEAADYQFDYVSDSQTDDTYYDCI